MPRLLLSAALLFAIHFSLFTPAMAQRPKTPVVLSVGDLLANYGLDSALVNDTTAALNYLEDQPQDYVVLTNLCVSLRTKAQAAVNSLSDDYPHRDSLIWIDTNTVVADFAIYEYRLRRFADLMGHQSIRYSRLEQQRVEAEKEAARQRAIEEAHQQQLARDKQADELRNSIDIHHRSIITACDGVGISDRNKLKNLKDLYYSYLMVYNKYDLSPGHATDQSISQLDELNTFQSDLLENILGNNSLPAQIDNFKNQLKARCENDNSDVYRSYSRLFRSTNVPVSFADIREYEDYLNRLHTLIAIQQRYLLTIELRATINANTQTILNLYNRKYRSAANAYKDVLRNLDIVPAFTTNAESQIFIQNLNNFIDAQQRYIELFPLLDAITHRSDSITSSPLSVREISRNYNDILPTIIPLPSFKDLPGSDLYHDQLLNVERIQQCYLDVLRLRNTINTLDDSVYRLRKSDRTLYKGYKLLHKQADLAPRFSTLQSGQSAISNLNTYIEMQRLVLQTIQKRKNVDRTADEIENLAADFRYIRKAYSKMQDLYLDIEDITNLEDLRRYSRQLDSTAAMQQAFLNTLRSDLVIDANNRLKRESDVEKIKLIVGLK